MPRITWIFLILSFLIITVLCTKHQKTNLNFTGKKHEVELMTIDPGHFHAALVQKIMYDQISPEVYVFAPKGPDLEDHLNRIDGFNNRTENPTQWKVTVFLGSDYFEKMIREKPGNVLITSGNNKKKIEYIKAAVDAGINVLADKPMCINKSGYEMLKKAFISAEKNGVLLYDIMTERSEITTMLQKELIHIPEVFGELEKGTLDDPAVIKESVHHFFKYVAGNPIKRPAWFFDVSQQGDAIVDVTTHLVDLVQWECFPEQIIDFQSDIEILSAKHWPTHLSLEQFKKVTRLSESPDYLQSKIKEDLLSVYCNGEINYTIKDIHAKVMVEWKYRAPEGGGDTHFSVIRGTRSNVVIRQGKEQNYRPELYIEVVKKINRRELGKQIENAIAKLQTKYPGIEIKENNNQWQIIIPDRFRIGHEAHFGQVTERYLQYLKDGKLPDWEIPNMITKYHITTAALEMAKLNGN